MHIVFVCCVYYVYVLICAYMYLHYVCLYITPVCIHVMHACLCVFHVCICVCICLCVCMCIIHVHVRVCVYMCGLIFLTLLSSTLPIKTSLDLAIFHYNNLLEGEFLEERVNLFKGSSYTLLDSFSKCWDNALQGNQTVWRLWGGALQTPDCRACKHPGIVRTLRFVTMSEASCAFPTAEFGLLLLLLLLLSRFSRVRLCATPETAAHQAPPSLGLAWRFPKDLVEASWDGTEFSFRKLPPTILCFPLHWGRLHRFQAAVQASLALLMGGSPKISLYI